MDLSKARHYPRPIHTILQLPSLKSISNHAPLALPLHTYAPIAPQLPEASEELFCILRDPCFRQGPTALLGGLSKTTEPAGLNQISPLGTTLPSGPCAQAKSTSGAFRPNCLRVDPSGPGSAGRGRGCPGRGGRGCCRGCVPEQRPWGACSLARRACAPRVTCGGWPVWGPANPGPSWGAACSAQSPGLAEVRRGLQLFPGVPPGEGRAPGTAWLARAGKEQ